MTPRELDKDIQDKSIILSDINLLWYQLAMIYKEYGNANTTKL